MTTDSTISELAKAVATRADLRRLLRRIRMEHGKSIRTIARENTGATGQAGLSRTTISRYLSGDGEIPLSFVEQFSTACGVSEQDRKELTVAWKRTLDVPPGPPPPIPDQRSESGTPARPLPDPAHLLTLEVMVDVAGNLDGEAGGLAAARRLYERVRSVRSEMLGAHDPRTLEAAHNVGTVLAQLDEYKIARRILSETYDARRRELGPDVPATLATLENLATTMAEMGEMDAAIELFERALAARRPETSPGHARYTETAEKLLIALNRVGDQSRARQVARDLDQARKSRRVPRSSGGEHGAL
ncbi:helix-turn-helix transcriptional regulator [Micromonospora sp. WMMD998]|uniref:helix-turn-helix domain-containing protein n=1 Tax=Micromonospora sp. WMMD998 TaxID=3016092 RepID=UPI00249CE8BE|nr:helix-turn-helix transcriptional regulator [Micromonospora sp. WMMD998]WFE39943.1 helix-turn-helix transcriptional regulator [Micromonospora sp. WMMD998]